MRQRSPHWKRSGAVLVQVTIALIALLGIAAFALDITRLHVAAQHAQAVADGAALAGVVGLPDFPTGQALAVETVDGNNWDMSYSDALANPDNVPEWYAWVNPSEDITYYPPGSTISAPDGTVVMQLGPNASGIGVRALVRVTYGLARVLGLDEGSRMREAVAVVAPGGSALPVAPIWISEGTRPDYTEPEPDGGYPIVDLVYDDLAHPPVEGTIAPGSFGFLDFSTPGYDWFSQLLSGYDVAPEVYAGAYTSIGTVETAYSGEHVGQWVQPLEQETGQDAGTARLERAESEPWATETYDDHSSDNPHIILVPVVTYLGGSGTNAELEVVEFAAMWLEEVVQQGGDKCIRVRFLNFEQFTGIDIDPQGANTGVFVRKLIL